MKKKKEKNWEDDLNNLNEDSAAEEPESGELAEDNLEDSDLKEGFEEEENL